MHRFNIFFLHFFHILHIFPYPIIRFLQLFFNLKIYKYSHLHKCYLILGDPKFNSLFLNNAIFYYLTYLWSIFTQFKFFKTQLSYVNGHHKFTFNNLFVSHLVRQKYLVMLFRSKINFKIVFQIQSAIQFPFFWHFKTIHCLICSPQAMG